MDSNMKNLIWIFCCVVALYVYLWADFLLNKFDYGTLAGIIVLHVAIALSIFAIFGINLFGKKDDSFK